MRIYRVNKVPQQLNLLHGECSAVRPIIRAYSSLAWGRGANAVTTNYAQEQAKRLDVDPGHVREVCAQLLQALGQIGTIPDLRFLARGYDVPVVCDLVTSAVAVTPLASRLPDSLRVPEVVNMTELDFKGETMANRKAITFTNKTYTLPT